MMVTNALGVFVLAVALMVAEGSWGTGTFITPSLHVFNQSYVEPQSLYKKETD